MENSKQLQKAGDNSNQFQAQTINVFQGITEERARAIFNEEQERVLAAYANTALEIANERIALFEEELMQRVAKSEQMLNAFSDPVFIGQLLKTQQVAAVTERKEDYGLLAELLVCHVQKGEDRKKKTGIHKAIEIVDLIDNDALCALTVAHSLSTFVPRSGDIMQGLKVYSNLFERIMYQELPKGMEWLDHLDTLGAIRLSALVSLNKVSEFIPKSLCGYACIGIEKGSSQYEKAIQILLASQLSPSMLVDNECLHGFVRLQVKDVAGIKEIVLDQNGRPQLINEKESEALKRIWELYIKDSELQNKANENFMEKWRSFDVLKKLEQWWDSIPNGFNITQVGKVLAHTNAKRCFPGVPDLL